MFLKMADQILFEDSDIIIVLPLPEGVPIVCPVCKVNQPVGERVAVGKYGGERKIENFSRHCKQYHDTLNITYQCLGCQFRPGNDIAVTSRRKIANRHVGRVQR